MMRPFYSLIILIHCGILSSQITINKSTLPEIGDELEYKLFFNYEGNNAFKDKGENLVWTYSSLNFGVNSSENFEDIKTTTLADSFPDANMLVTVSGFETAAIRSEEKIELIGLSVGNFSGFDIDASADFNKPFIFRTTPFKYQDKYNDEFSFKLQFSSDLVPGLDTIQLPLPGAVLDSIRISTKVIKSEEATAWGTLNLYGENYEVLKIEQMDSTNTKIEAGLVFFGTLVWFDVTALIGQGFDNLNNNVITYKFLANGSKKSILEFRETSEIDTSGMAFNTTSGRMSNDVVTSISNTFEDQINVFPNPSNGRISINTEASKMPDCIKIYNLNGVLVKNLVGFKGNSVSLNDQANGLYIMKYFKNDNYLGYSKVSLLK